MIALMMSDHPRQEEPVKRSSPRCTECRHLFRRRHARHSGVPVRMLAVRGRWIWCGLTPFPEPALHERDFVGLGSPNPSGYVMQLLPGRAVRHQRCHLHRLMMVVDHVLHEAHIVWGETRVRDLRGFGRTEHCGCLAGRAGLDNRYLLTHPGRGRRSQAQNRATQQNPYFSYCSRHVRRSLISHPDSLARTIIKLKARNLRRNVDSSWLLEGDIHRLCSAQINYQPDGAE
jgi:hypothetical protein